MIAYTTMTYFGVAPKISEETDSNHMFLIKGQVYYKLET